MSRLPSLLPLALVSVGALASLGASCHRTPAQPPAQPPSAVRDAAPAAQSAPTLRLYFLVDLDGYLEPCGCNQRPLGGIDRAARAIANERNAAPRSALVAAGNTFFLDPHLDERMVWQERSKAESLAGILRGMNLVGFAPGPSDFALGADTWSRLSTAVNAPALAANAAGMQPSRIVDVEGTKVALVGVSDFAPAGGAPAQGAPATTDPIEAARAAVTAAKAQGAQVVVVLASVPRRVARSIASSLDQVDFVVAAREEGNTPPPPERIGRAYLLTAPNQGKHLGVLDLYVRGEGAFQDASDTSAAAARTRLDGRIRDLRERLAQWAHDPSVDRAAVASQQSRLDELVRQRAALDVVAVPAQGRYFRARTLEISPDVEKLPEVQQRIAEYFRAVNEHNRVEYASLRPMPPQPGVARYVGGEACRECHEEAFAVWEHTPHSLAYRTLEDISKNFNLSCVGCHVTGYRQPGGSEVVQNEGLRDVQCEACHGPGSAHIAARGEAARRATIRTQVPGEFCATQCHTPEHSDHFNYETYLPRILGPGHGRPVDWDGGMPDGGRASHPADASIAPAAH